VARATVASTRDGTVPRTDGGEESGVDAQQLWPCPACGDDRVFEQPPCADGHGTDGDECPEWACTDCGAALLSGGPGHASAVPVPRAA
jgi:hypothetical protein